MNPDQAEAASHLGGPALVLAGPGTGKTTTLVGRYCFLVDQGVDPGSIFVATFTRKAALQLKERIAAQAGIGTARLPIGTFHSLCLGILREVGERVGVPRDFRTISDGQQFRLLRDLKLDWPGELEDLKDAIARLKDRLVTPEQFRREAAACRGGDAEERLLVAGAYARYQEALRKRGLFDFGDQIALAVQALREHPEVRERYSERYRFVMVDEFQDINVAQDALIQALLAKHRNLWVVGDDDQAIYGWRGSDVRYITGFEKTYPGARVLRLSTNYRSPRTILDVADRVIRNNRRRLPKTLEATRATKAPVVLCRAEDEHREAEWVVGAVRKLLAAGTRPREVAVLLRTNYLTLPFDTELRRAGIPFVIRGGPGFWELKEVQTILEALWPLAEAAVSSPCPWAGLPYLHDRLAEVVRRNRSRPFPELVETLAEAVAAQPPLSASDEIKVRWAGAARQVAAESKEFQGADAFLSHVAAASTAPPADEDTDAVVLSTIHQAKGLEWDAVFVCACEANLLPHEKAEDGEEERRLAFVAATRAKRFLTLSCCRSRNGRPADPSPFLAELTEGAPAAGLSWRRAPVTSETGSWLEPLLRQGTPPKPADEKVRSTFAHPKPARKKAGGKGRKPMGPVPGAGPKHPVAPEPSARAQNARVFHSAFGSGVVQRVDGDKWTVAFAKHGVKVIRSEYLMVLGGREAGTETARSRNRS
ncbi:MAG: ATP-dependent helicase [Deferrisomatales bacterium]